MTLEAVCNQARIDDAHGVADGGLDLSKLLLEAGDYIARPLLILPRHKAIGKSFNDIVAVDDARKLVHDQILDPVFLHARFLTISTATTVADVVRVYLAALAGAAVSGHRLTTFAAKKLCREEEASGLLFGSGCAMVTGDHALHVIEKRAINNWGDAMIVPNVSKFVNANVFFVLQNTTDRILVKRISASSAESIAIEIGLDLNRGASGGIFRKDSPHDGSGCRIDLETLIRSGAEPVDGFAKSLPF